MIEKRYYNSKSVRDALEVYERHYKLSSAEFYEAHQVDGPSVREIPLHQRGIWAGLWRELQDLDEPSLAGHVCRSLELA